jgi:hypothetical protein
MVTPELVTPQNATYETTGGGAVLAAVLNVKLPDVFDVFAAFADTTSKSYVVFAVNPVSVTECAVVSPAVEAVEP